MSRDYANRKSSAAKSRGTKSNAKTKGTNLSLIPLVLIFGLLAGFGYFLWSIKGSAGDEPGNTKVSEPAPTRVLKVVPKQDPNALPPKPTEEWTYLKELENKSVDVEIPPEALLSAGPYQMQCASFRQEAQANAMKATIAFQGIDAQVRKVDGTTGVWYKVVLGPYENKRAAEKHKHIMQNSRINGCQIMLM